MALIRCMECGRDVSDKAEKCPGCGAPVIVENAPIAPASVGFEGGEFIGTKAMVVDLAKRAIARVGYRLDAADETAGTVTFTTGMTMGSWSGVSGTIAMQEVEPYHFKAIGQAKQNVRGGQVLALNLFDEANGKVQNVITDMQALAMIAPGKEPPTPASSCIVVLAVLAGATGSATMGLWHALA